MSFALSGAALVWAPAPARADAGLPAAIVAHYDADVPVPARAAVNLAMAIWSQRIESSVPIDVDVAWGAGLPSGVAAATEPVSYHQTQPDGPLLAVALANAIVGYDLDPTSADIHLMLGTGVSWYMGLDGNTPASATDMVTMVMHELTHGLGFVGSFRYADANQLRWGRVAGDRVLPLGVDAGLLDVATGSRLTDEVAFANPSPGLLAEATSGRIVWGGGARDSRGHMPVMYAQSSYEPHSSLVHFDDAAYPPGDPDALMTSLIRRGESIRHIGPATLGVLADLGWRVRPEVVTAVASAPRRAVVARAVAAAPATTQPVPTTVPVATTTAALGDDVHGAAAVRSRQQTAPDAGPVANQGIAVLVAIALTVLIATHTWHRDRRRADQSS